MARPLRIEYENAFYHVMSRGNRHAAIFEDDRDHQRFLEILGDVCDWFSWRIWTRCEMRNHFHLLVQTQEPTLSLGMRQLKGVYTQWSNTRHRQSGHLFQGRYKAVLVDADSYLRELIRYIARNPLEAGMVSDLKQYPWSSHVWMTSRKTTPSWFAKEDALALFTSNRSRAVGVYRAFVAKEAFDYAENLRHQIFMGGQDFIERAQSIVAGTSKVEVPRQQQKTVATVAALDRGQGRDALIAEAYSVGFRLREIADYVGLHYSTVSRLARKDAKNKN